LFLACPSYINKPKFLLLYIIKYPLSLSSRGSYAIRNFMRFENTVKENKSLRNTVDLLNQRVLRYKDIEGENIRLNRLLDFKEQSPKALKAARVISRDSSNLFGSILIDKGSRAGIRPDTVVITDAGLAGRICEISPHMSRVMFITDSNFRVSAMVLRSRQIGMVYSGLSGFCKLRYLPLEADVEVGDEIVTSGFSDIYPKGLLIGSVVEIDKEPQGVGIYAVIEPAVDLYRMEEVLCIE